MTFLTEITMTRLTEKQRVWIRGVKDRGRVVISSLEKLGGVNEHHLKGSDSDCIYYIDGRGNINCCFDPLGDEPRSELLTLVDYIKASCVESFLPPESRAPLPDVRWRPKKGEKYWTMNVFFCERTFTGDEADRECIARGGSFRDWGVVRQVYDSFCRYINIEPKNKIE